MSRAEARRAPGGRLPGRPDLVFAGKREATVARDARNIAALEAMGWSVLTLWECQLKDPDQVLARLGAFLGGPGSENPAPS